MVSPVTHTAEVTVKSAFIKVMWPVAFEIGSVSRAVPTLMQSRKLRMIMVAG
jgi:hypothetical protein